MSEQATPPPAAPYGAPQAQPHGADPTAQPAGGPPPGFEAPKQKKSGGVIRRIVVYIVIALVVAIGGYVYKLMTGAPATAGVGDCMVGQTADALKTIDCTEATAEWKVIGKLSDKSETAANDDAICSAYPTTEVSFWEGEKGGNGYVLCLEPVKK